MGTGVPESGRRVFIFRRKFRVSEILWRASPTGVQSRGCYRLKGFKQALLPAATVHIITPTPPPSPNYTIRNFLLWLIQVLQSPFQSENTLREYFTLASKTLQNWNTKIKLLTLVRLGDF